ncbi:hypothetical protein [Halomonas sp. WWR20]
MKRLIVLGLLLAAAAGLYLFFLPSSEPESADDLKRWNMQDEIQKASDNERNPWKRDY